MADIIRRSPVQFDASTLRTEMRDHFKVVLEYDGEGNGPWLVDLSHKTRWDLQNGAITDFTPSGVAVPGTPGQCAFGGGVLINRMNRTQAAIWHLGAAPESFPEESAYTDVSEATVFLALFGPNAFRIAEKLSALDFLDPAKTAPFLLQGPFSHVPCQVVALEKNAEMGGGILLTCSRGYGHSMTHAIMDAGAEFGLRPAGEKRFDTWIEGLGL
jgi:hypothetical protein